MWAIVETSPYETGSVPFSMIQVADSRSTTQLSYECASETWKSWRLYGQFDGASLMVNALHRKWHRACLIDVSSDMV